MKFSIKIICFYCFIALLSCRKDKVPKLSIDLESFDTCKCEPLFPLDNQWEITPPVTQVNDSIYYLHPKFNPNNDREFIYTELIGQGIKRIIKYNLDTESKSVVFEGEFYGVADWGKQDWILFTEPSGHIYKIESDGSNYSQVTSGGMFFHPTFNKEGDNFIAQHGNVDVSEHFQGTVWDLEGNKLDTFNYSVRATSDWGNQNYFATLYGTGLHIIDPYLNETIINYDGSKISEKPFVGEFIWLNENEALINNDKAIYKVNIWNGSYEKKICQCEKLYYSSGSSNSAGSKVIFSKIESEVIDELSFLVRSSIVIYDVESNSFKEIDI